MAYAFVIPAKAGIHANQRKTTKTWIPAFVGIVKVHQLGSRICL
jgi:hypothetical protein